jgi:hypothetical protein
MHAEAYTQTHTYIHTYIHTHTEEKLTIAPLCPVAGHKQHLHAYADA